MAIRAVAIAPHDGSVWLTVDDNDEASTIVGAPGAGRRPGDVEVEAIRLDQLLDQLDLEVIDLLKLDVEGAEISALDGLGSDRLATIDQLSVEFHDAQGWVRPAEIRHSCRRLRDLGFLPICMSVRHWGDMLFVRRARLTRIEQGQVRWAERPMEFVDRARDRLART